MTLEELKDSFPGEWEQGRNGILWIRFDNGAKLMYDALGFWTNGQWIIIKHHEVGEFIQKQIKLCRLKNFK